MEKTERSGSIVHRESETRRVHLAGI